MVKSMPKNKKGLAARARKRASMMSIRSPAVTARESYKRILVDPCYAELPQSPYESGAGAIIGRVRGTVLGPSVIAHDSQVVAFHPVFGAFTLSVAGSGSSGQFFQYNGSAGIQGTLYNSVNNTNSARAIAGCLSVSFTGAENTRSGMVHCGVVSGAYIISHLISAQGGENNSIAPSTMAAQLGRVQRMPVDKCEVNWVPGEGDSSFVATNFSTTSNQQLSTLFERTNFCVIIVMGAPFQAGTTQGIALEWNATGVVEATPSAPNGLFNNSIAIDVAATTRPKYDYRDVVRDLGRKDPSWFLDTFKKVGKLVGGVVTGYATAGLPGALGYLIGASPTDNVGSKNNVRGKGY